MSATRKAITKADRPGNFTILQWRTSSHQPAWPVCTTSVCWHTSCWHFCSCTSHKTIPSLSELAVTQHCFSVLGFVFPIAIGFTQVWVMMARIGSKKIMIILRVLKSLESIVKYLFYYMHIIPAVYQLVVDLAFYEKNNNGYLLDGFCLLPIWRTLWLAGSEISARHFTAVMSKGQWQIVQIKIYSEQCIPKHWGFFLKGRTSLDYIWSNVLSFLHAIQLTISNFFLEILTNIFSSSCHLYINISLF